MNRSILMPITGIPTAGALSDCLPTAKIQLPNLVRRSIYVTIAAKSSHQNTVIFTETPPMAIEDAKTAWTYRT